METSEAQKLMAVQLDFTEIVDAIKAEPSINTIIGDRITFMPPQKATFPYVFFDVYSQTQMKSDDRHAVYFQCSCAWRLVAPDLWSRKEMDDFMQKILLIIQTFERKTINASTIGNPVTANIFMVEINKPVFFDDENGK